MASTPPAGVLLTSRQVEVVAAYARLWSCKLVAEALGIRESRVRQVLLEARTSAGVTSTGELLSALGWLKVPDTAA